MQVVTRIHYIGGFIGNQESEKAWLAEKVEGWTPRGVVRGGAPAPTDILRWPENFIPVEVGFLPARYRAHRGSIPPGGRGFGEILPPGTFQGRHRRSNIMRYYPPASQAGRSGDSKPNSILLGELDNLMCHHGLHLTAGRQSSKPGITP